jgi:hypothetical protein
MSALKVTSQCRCPAGARRQEAKKQMETLLRAVAEGIALALVEGGSGIG